MIQLDNVVKRYGDWTALDGLTAEFRPGVTGLLGPNGAGKSTLIKLLLGLVRLTEGRARVFDFDVATESIKVRQIVGFMPEDDCYFSSLQGVVSVSYAGEMAGIPRFTALRRAHEMLDYVAFGDERYREVQTYSTGMKQRVKLAQALIHSPKLVFLDEPTSGLDPQGRERMLRLIRDLWSEKGISVIVSTHILKDVEACCDQVLILGRGKLLVNESLEALQKPVSEQVRLDVAGDAVALAHRLSSLGYHVEPHPTGMFVSGGRGEPLAPVAFRAAVETGVAIRQCLPSRNSLEDIFLRAIMKEQHADL